VEIYIKLGKRGGTRPMSCTWSSSRRFRAPRWGDG